MAQARFVCLRRVRRQFDGLDNRWIVVFWLVTRVEIGHIRMRSAGNGRIKSRGSGSSQSQRV
jgi:hypothetical protein